MVEECPGCGRQVLMDDHICVITYEDSNIADTLDSIWERIKKQLPNIRTQKSND